MQIASIDFVLYANPQSGMIESDCENKLTMKNKMIFTDNAFHLCLTFLFPIYSEFYNFVITEKVRELNCQTKPSTITSTSFAPVSRNLFKIGVPSQDQHFIKEFRTEELEQLKSLHFGTGFISANIVIVSGLGGIGKTQFILAYVNNCLPEGEFSISWFSGETATLLRSSMIAFAAEAFGIPPEISEKMEFSALANEIVKNSNLPWVLVIEDVDVKYVELELLLSFLVSINCFVIVSSQDNALLKANARIGYISLKGLKLNDSVKLIQQTLQKDGINVDSEQAEILHNAVEGHPLALLQCISYIRQEKQSRLTYKFSNFLQDLESQERGPSEYQIDLDSKSPSSRTVNSILNMSFSKWLPLVYDCLLVLSYLHPNNVDGTLISNILSKVSDHPVVTKGLLETLKRCNLINVGEDIKPHCKDNVSKVDWSYCTVKIHGLVKSKIKRDLKTNPCKRLEILENLLQWVQQVPVNQLKRQHAPILSHIWFTVQQEEVGLFRENVGMAKSLFDKLRDISALRECFDFSSKMFDWCNSEFGQDSKITTEMQSSLYQSLFIWEKYKRPDED